MTDIDKTGGPAFPALKPLSYNLESPVMGMTLRDYIATAALQGIIAGCYAGNNSGFTPQGNVTAAYEYADFMIAQRDK